VITRRRRIDQHDDDDDRADEAMRHKRVRTQTLLTIQEKEDANTVVAPLPCFAVCCLPFPPL
jgi:hypothetical protein